jgi:hypothetical protein
MPRYDERTSVVVACSLLLSLVACAKTDNAMDAGGAEVPMLAPVSGASGASGQLASVAGRVSEAGSGAGTSGTAGSGGVTSVTIPQSVCSGELPVMQGFDAQMNMSTEPDWGCYTGSTSVDDADGGTAPSSGTATPAIIRVTYAPGNNVGFAGATVDQFFGPSTLGKPASTGVSDSTGQIMFQAASGTQRISMRLHAMTDPNSALSNFVDSYVLELPIAWPPSFNGVSAFISQGVDATLVNVLGSPDLGDKTKAFLGATVRDCQGHDVGGAQVELIDVSTDMPVDMGMGAGEPRGVYGRFALPDKTCTFTTPQRAEWLMLNAPVNVSNDAVSHQYKVRSKGRRRDSDAEPVILAEQMVELHSGGYTFTSPYRTWPVKAP